MAAVAKAGTRVTAMVVVATERGTMVGRRTAVHSRRPAAPQVARSARTRRRARTVRLPPPFRVSVLPVRAGSARHARAETFAPPFSARSERATRNSWTESASLLKPGGFGYNRAAVCSGSFSGLGRPSRE